MFWIRNARYGIFRTTYMKITQNGTRSEFEPPPSSMLVRLAKVPKAIRKKFASGLVFIFGAGNSLSAGDVTCIGRIEGVSAAAMSDKWGLYEASADLASIF